MEWIPNFSCKPIVLILSVDEKSSSLCLTYKSLQYDENSCKNLMADKKFYAIVLLTTKDGGKDAAKDKRRKDKRAENRKRKRALAGDVRRKAKKQKHS